MALVLCLAGCARPRATPLTWDQAVRDHVPRQITVRKVWDDVEDRLDGPWRDGRITHFIEVDIEGADDFGEPHPPEAATWPYDQLATSRPPPRVGSVLVVAPSDWLSSHSDRPRKRR